jgi:hypothetical protein
MKQLSLTLLLAPVVPAAQLRMSSGANPIRKVVTLMQDMQKEVAAEGEKDEELHKAFMCYCKQNSGAQESAIAEAESDMNSNAAIAEETKGLKDQTAEELKGHKADREEDKKALAAASDQRAKEKSEYDASHAQTSADLEGCGKAIVALEKGTSKSFLQTGFASSLMKLVSKKRAEASMDVNDADTVMAFLQGDYHSVTGEIVGILKNMKEEFAKSLAEMEEAEASALKSFEELKGAKEASIAAATAAIEEKTEKKGELAVKATEAAAAAEAAKKELEDAQNFAANLKETCATKQTEYDARQKSRQEEITAIGEAINVLNDDDALDVFKAAVKQPEEEPKAMFLQMRVARASPKSRAVAMLQSIKQGHKTSKAVALVMQTALHSLKSAKPDFGKILIMIDDMVKLLTQEGKDDEKTRDWCNEELNKAVDHKKALGVEIETLNTRLEEATAGIEEAQATIAHKTEEIKALDAAVAEATENRKKENAAFTETMTLNATAVKLLNKAKNKLNKFYNPSQYKAPEERELTEEERLLQGAGQDIGETTTEAFSFLQTDSSAAPPPPPETGSYEKKGEKSNSVLSLLDLIINDLNKETQAAEHDEKTAQRDYEKLMQDSAASRAEFAEIITQKTGAIADMEEQKNQDGDSHAAATAQLAENGKQTAELHGECDFLLENFDSRKEQRTNEIEGLKNAKAVLNGANFE